METFVTALLGSGLGAALVTALFQLWNSIRENELQFIKNQLRGLYGPLYYFTCLNKNLFDLCKNYHTAYRKEYIDKKISPESKIDFRKEAEAMIEEVNSYITDVMQNNVKILELFEKSWDLIDPDDVEIFSQFQIDMARMKRIGDQMLRTPLAAIEHLGPISFMRPQMIDRVKDKWDLKRKRMEQLTKGFFGRARSEN